MKALIGSIRAVHEDELVGVLSVASVSTESGTDAVTQVQTRYELPNRGKSGKVYFVKDENATYRWDEENLKYFCVGRDYREIEYINGGDANGNQNA